MAKNFVGGSQYGEFVAIAEREVVKMDVNNQEATQRQNQYPPSNYPPNSYPHPGNQENVGYGPAYTSAPFQDAPQEKSRKKPWHKRWCAIALAVIVGLVIITGLAGGDDDGGEQFTSEQAQYALGNLRK